jgi:hypothetical protein
VWRWLKSLWDRQDHTAEIKLLAYGAGVVAAIVWLSNRELTTEWNYAFGTFCLMITGGLTVEAFGNRIRKEGDK